MGGKAERIYPPPEAYMLLRNAQPTCYERMPITAYISRPRPFSASYTELLIASMPQTLSALCVGRFSYFWPAVALLAYALRDYMKALSQSAREALLIAQYRAFE